MRLLFGIAAAMLLTVSAGAQQPTAQPARALKIGDTAEGSFSVARPSQQFRFAIDAGQRVHLTFTSPDAGILTSIRATGQTDQRNLLTTEGLPANGVHRHIIQSSVDQDVLVEIHPVRPRSPTAQYQLKLELAPNDSGPPPSAQLAPGGSAPVELAADGHWQDGATVTDFLIQAAKGDILVAEIAGIARHEETSLPQYILLNFIDAAGKRIFDATLPMEPYQGRSANNAGPGSAKVAARATFRAPEDGVHRLRVELPNEYRKRSFAGELKVSRVEPRAASGGESAVAKLTLDEEAEAKFSTASRWEGKTQIESFRYDGAPGKYEVFVKTPEIYTGESYSASASFPGGTQTREPDTPGYIFLTVEAIREGPIDIEVRRTSDVYSVPRRVSVKISRSRY